MRLICKYLIGGALAYINLKPVVVALGGIFVLGERLSLAQVLWGVAVIAGGSDCELGIRGKADG